MTKWYAHVAKHMNMVGGPLWWETLGPGPLGSPLKLALGGFKVGGPKARRKGAPLMTSSYSANRDKYIWSSLRHGRRRIHCWDYGMTDITGENAKGCSWCTTLKTLKVGKTRLATHNSKVIAIGIAATSLFSCPISTHSSSINYKVYPFESFTLPPLKKCLVVGILNLFTFIWESVKT